MEKCLPYRLLLLFCTSWIVVGCTNLEQSIDSGSPPVMSIQTASYYITGVVIDAVTLDAIEGAEVSTGVSAFVKATTNERGEFKLRMRGHVQQMGVKQLFASKRGYETKMFSASRQHVGSIALNREE